MATALRALHERSALVNKLSNQEEARGQPDLAEAWSLRAEEFEKEADVIRDAIGRLDRAERAEFETAGRKA